MKAIIALCIAVLVLCLLAIAYQMGVNDTTREFEAAISHDGPEAVYVGHYRLIPCYWGESVKIYTLAKE